MESVVEKQIHTPGHRLERPMEKKCLVFCAPAWPLHCKVGVRGGGYMMGEVGWGGAVSSLCDFEPWGQEGPVFHSKGVRGGCRDQGFCKEYPVQVP